MRKIIGLLFFVSITATVFGQQNTENTFGKGFYNVEAQDKSYSMKFAARMQNLYVGEWDIDDVNGLENGSSNFLIRRARLKMSGYAYSPKLKYKVEIGLSNRDISSASLETKNAPRILLDAVVKWNFAGNFELWAGQTKLPGNRERVISSSKLQFVDRSKLNSEYNIDRDFGIQLHHHISLGDKMIVREAFAFSQGEGRNITVGNLGGYDYTGRIEFLPFGEFTKGGDYFSSDLKRESSPKLAIGISYDYNDGAVREHGQDKGFMLIDQGAGYYHATLSTLFADLMFKYNGFSFMAEYANKTTDDPIAKNTDGTATGDMLMVGSGFNAQAGYLFKSNWELAARLTSITPDTKLGENPFNQYTLGVSRYIVGHKLKVQSDISYLKEQTNPDASLMYRMQFEVHF